MPKDTQTQNNASYVDWSIYRELALLIIFGLINIIILYFPKLYCLIYLNCFITLGGIVLDHFVALISNRDKVTIVGYGLLSSWLIGQGVRWGFTCMIVVNIIFTIIMQLICFMYILNLKNTKERTPEVLGALFCCIIVLTPTTEPFQSLSTCQIQIAMFLFIWLYNSIILITKKKEPVHLDFFILTLPILYSVFIGAVIYSCLVALIKTTEVFLSLGVKSADNKPAQESNEVDEIEPILSSPSNTINDEEMILMDQMLDDVNIELEEELPQPIRQPPTPIKKKVSFRLPSTPTHLLSPAPLINIPNNKKHQKQIKIINEPLLTDKINNISESKLIHKSFKDVYNTV